MTAELIDGKKIAARIKEDLKKEAEELKAKGIHPVLAAVLVGEDPASKKYIASKEKTCEAIGINSIGYKLPKSASQKEIIELVDTLNADSRVNGILVQLPLPKGLNEKEIMSRISPDKDVDGIGPHALGRLVLDDPGFIPCTPHGVMKMIEAYNITPYGKHAVIVGRSVIVGKPLALLLLRKNATVTMCHSKTSNLKEECLRADILCVAVGKAEMITGDMVKEGAVVIDIGVNVTSDGKLVGDVDFDTAKERAAYITPVPGGAGPMTIAMLMYNTVLAAKMRCS
ncbi:bifunctional methylenetetrahydrofolate dehydrogenase/methenyltetrahydrofolate cyclohydrolase FolD [Thermodesulfovibrionales bacterium]|nr:bifunctional methylenetetrahydrofolate dehydrogenase/methenyltetrahydrofolate cyclohydrolase FolD [Thermodesulfovibrionales bacterium]MCL0068192.1 bifunctional methylenetetrahydrofolate dehydrogenase/methenyltetrahydrofolate cyclohydrolase FolD [Thermodesulfovibrionales bacterium]